MILNAALKHYYLFVTCALLQSTLVWSQEWTPAMERELRWKSYETMTGSVDSYAEMAKLRKGARNDFETLFTSPSAPHVLDIPGTPGLLFTEDIAVNEYSQIASTLLEDRYILIQGLEILWISPSREISDTKRAVSMTFSKKMKWYPPALENALEWTVNLIADLEVNLDTDGIIESIQISAVRLQSPRQVYARIKTEITQRPIPFRSSSAPFNVLIEGSPLFSADDTEAIQLIPESGIELEADTSSDVMLMGKNTRISLPKPPPQSAFLKNPTLLDETHTIRGFQYHGRFTAGLTTTRLLGNGIYNASPISNVSTPWSIGYRLSFSAPANDTWDWMVTLGQQNWAAEALFNATQLNTRSIDPDQMEYDRITDITEGVESLSAVTLFAGAGLAHHFTDQLFIRASANRTLTTSRYNASAMVQQRGHYDELYGIIIDESGIYDFGMHAASVTSQYQNSVGWMGEAAIGIRLPFGSASWASSARPMFYLSAGVRHHTSGNKADALEWVEGTNELRGALETFGNAPFQSLFFEAAFDLRQRTPPNTN